MPKYRLTAYTQANSALYTRLCDNMQEALKTVFNHPWLSHVGYIEYRRHKYNISDVYRLADRTKKYIQERGCSNE